jgi:hypothetical protein
LRSQTLTRAPLHKHVHTSTRQHARRTLNTPAHEHVHTGAQPQDSGAWRLVMIPLRIVRALYKEAVVTLSGGGSVFLDSPLNEDGVAQVVPMHARTHTHTHTHTRIYVYTYSLVK